MGHSFFNRRRAAESAMRFTYVAWFRDSRFPPDDQDYEWPACFVIDAPSAADALAWGDRLARSRAERSDEQLQFLFSNVETFDPADHSLTTLPVVAFGEDAGDIKIGW